MGLFFNNQDIANAGITEKAVLYSRSRFSWELSEIGAAEPDGARLLRETQPPSGGCVLKQNQHRGKLRERGRAAAFGRLCVETQAASLSGAAVAQPPSGGCVLELIGKQAVGICNTQLPLGAACCRWMKFCHTEQHA